MQSIQPTVQELHRCGIGAILDYAAESDVHTNKGVAGADSLSETNYSVITRTYGYENEKKCDSHVRIFMHALEAARTLPGQGFAAIKVRSIWNYGRLFCVFMQSLAHCGRYLRRAWLLHQDASVASCLVCTSNFFIQCQWICWLAIRPCHAQQLHQPFIGGCCCCCCCHVAVSFV